MYMQDSNDSHKYQHSQKQTCHEQNRENVQHQKKKELKSNPAVTNML